MLDDNIVSQYDGVYLNKLKLRVTLQQNGSCWNRAYEVMLYEVSKFNIIKLYCSSKCSTIKINLILMTNSYSMYWSHLFQDIARLT